MTEILIVLSLFICVVWLITRAVFMLVRIDKPDDIPSRHFDPISTYVSDNYGQHFLDENKFVGEQLRKL